MVIVHFHGGGPIQRHIFIAYIAGRKVDEMDGQWRTWVKEIKNGRGEDAVRSAADCHSGVDGSGAKAQVKRGSKLYPGDPVRRNESTELCTSLGQFYPVGCCKTRQVNRIGGTSGSRAVYKDHPVAAVQTDEHEPGGNRHTVPHHKPGLVIWHRCIRLGDNLR